MAIYQYHLTFTPRQTILRFWDEIPVTVQLHDNPAFDEVDLINVKWWDKENIDFETIENSISLFADQVEWTKKYENIKTFSNEDSNDITICKGKYGYIDEMSFRIDLRELNKDFIDKVLAMAIKLDCLLLDSYGNLFEPTHRNLFEMIKKSNAFKFVTNPTDFLNNLEPKN